MACCLISNLGGPGPRGCNWRVERLVGLKLGIKPWETGPCTELGRTVGAVDSDGHLDLPGRGDNTNHSGAVLAVGTSLTHQLCSLAWLGLLPTTTLGVEEERPPGTHGQGRAEQRLPWIFAEVPWGIRLGWSLFLALSLLQKVPDFGY